MSEAKRLTLKDMKSKDAEIRLKRQEGTYKNPNAVKNDVERLLDDLPNAYDERGTIGNSEDFQWACRAIVYWNSFLRSEWRTAKFVPFPKYVPPSGSWVSRAVVCLIKFVKDEVGKIVLFVQQHVFLPATEALNAWDRQHYALSAYFGLLDLKSLRSEFPDRPPFLNDQ